MPFFIVNGHRLYYETHGDLSCQPLVLLHQGLGAASEWKPQIAYFAPRHHVLAFDRWGYGRSDPRPAFQRGYLNSDTQETIALFDHLGLREALIVGHSDGGTIALLLAAQRPDLARALVLEAAHIYHESRIEQGIRRLIEWLATERGLAHLTGLHGEEKARSLIEHWPQHWLDPANFNSPILSRERLEKVGCPALVIQGEDDEYALPQHARDIHAALPRGQLWLIPGCGHTPRADLGDAFNDTIAAFFTSAQTPETPM
jgi:pimeloyl-ACP methyl ester carboxylesterase